MLYFLTLIPAGFKVLTAYVFAFAANFEPSASAQKARKKDTKSRAHVFGQLPHSSYISLTLPSCASRSHSLSLCSHLTLGRDVANKSPGDGDSMLHAAHRVIYASIITIYIHTDTRLQLQIQIHVVKQAQLHAPAVRMCVPYTVIYRLAGNYLYLIRFPSSQCQWLP